VNPRRTTLRATLDLLTHDFAEAVLRAVRSATLDELAAMLGSRGAPRLARRSTAAPSRPDAALAGPARPRRAGRPRALSTARQAAPLAELVEHTEAYPDVVIVDPVAVLARRVPNPSAPPVAATVPDDEDDQAAIVPTSRDAAAPPTRPGEDVLRATGGGLVLRRRRSPRASEGAAQ
jgi:hypothetical protein